MSISVSAAFALYVSDHIVFVGQSAKTQESYKYTSDQLIKWRGDFDLCAMTFTDVRDWKLWLDKGRDPNTVRGYIVCLRVVLKFLRYRGYQVINAEDIPTPKRVSKQVEYLTEIEMESLLQAVSRRQRGYATVNRLRNIAILKTLYATGLRNAELCALDRNSIKDNTFTVIGKGNKPRICFIDDDSIAAIDEYLGVRSDENPALFVSKEGNRITPDGLRRIFRFIRLNYPEFAGVHPHTVRHSYATKLLKRRIDIRYVKEFMGHSSLETTAHYTHVINEELRDIYLKAHSE